MLRLMFYYNHIECISSLMKSKLTLDWIKGITDSPKPLLFAKVHKTISIKYIKDSCNLIIDFASFQLKSKVTKDS